MPQKRGAGQGNLQRGSMDVCVKLRTRISLHRAPAFTVLACFYCAFFSLRYRQMLHLLNADTTMRNILSSVNTLKDGYTCHPEQEGTPRMGDAASVEVFFTAEKFPLKCKEQWRVLLPSHTPPCLSVRLNRCLR